MNRINYIKRTNKTFLSGNKYMGKIKNSAYSPQLNNNHNNTYILSLINRCDNSYSSKINHKKYSHNVIFLIMLIIFLITVCSPHIIINATLKGIKLWALSVMPGLLVAMIIIGCINYYMPVNSRLGLVFIIFISVLCGFPIGAINCINYKKQSDSRIIDNITGYCNISSPGFVIGYIYYGTINNSITIIKFLIAVYLPVIILCAVQLIKYPVNNNNNKNSNKEPINNCTVKIFYNRTSNTRYKVNPNSYNIQHTDNMCNNGRQHTINSHKNFFNVLDNAIIKSIDNVLKMCGYIVIFSCICSMTDVLLGRFNYINMIICSLLEITNGIYLIASSDISASAKAAFILTANAFGGISTLMQTIGIAGTSNNNNGINIKKYIYQKIMLSLATAGISLLLIYVF